MTPKSGGLEYDTSETFHQMLRRSGKTLERYTREARHQRAAMQAEREQIADEECERLVGEAISLVFGGEDE